MCFANVLCVCVCSYYERMRDCSMGNFLDGNSYLGRNVGKDTYIHVDILLLGRVLRNFKFTKE